jgi:hypothetical protein
MMLKAMEVTKDQRKYAECGFHRSTPRSQHYVSCFGQSQFSLAGITEEKTNFPYVLSQLDHRYAMEVQTTM